MKIIIAFLFSLIAYESSFCQNLDNLDKINGFRKFKLGSNVSSFSNIKLHTNQIKLNGVSNYIYTGSDMSDFYGVPIDQITLSFYKSKLYQINVSFGTIYTEYRYDQFDVVQSNLEANFGKSYFKISPSPQAEILNGYMWDAKTVNLESLRLRMAERDGSRNPQFNYIQGYLLFTHKKLQKEQQASELED